MQENLQRWALYAFISMAILCVSTNFPPRYARSLATYEEDKIETEPDAEIESAYSGDLFNENQNSVRNVRRSHIAHKMRDRIMNNLKVSATPATTTNEAIIEKFNSASDDYSNDPPVKSTSEATVSTSQATVSTMFIEITTNAAEPTSEESAPTSIPQASPKVIQSTSSSVTSPVPSKTTTESPIDSTEKRQLPIVTSGHNIEDNPEEEKTTFMSVTLSSKGCEELPDEYKSCDEMCKAGGNKDAKEGSVPIIFIIVCPLTTILFIILIVCCWVTCRKQHSEPVEQPQQEERFEDPGTRARVSVDDAAQLPRDVDNKEEKSGDAAVQEDTPSLKNNPALERMRDKLKKTQENLIALRKHAKKCSDDHKDALKKKFTPMGPIYIPMEPEVPPPVDIPPNVTLTNVTWDENLNELWEIGSDVDDIELDQDFVLNPDSVTEDEASQRSGKSKKSGKSKSKKSKKSKKSQKSQKDKKDGEVRTPKLDDASVPSSSGLPSVSTPAPTAPAAVKPNAPGTKKDQNKSKEY